MDFFFDVAGPTAAVIVFLFAAAEGGLLVGLFLPGEAPLLIAGVLAFQGRVSLTTMLVAACAGAVLGDSAGYWLGRRYGRRLEATKPGLKIGPARWNRARAYVRERGGKAVFLGRFVSIFRTLAPPVAGSANMPYRRFVVWNAPAAIVFATALVMAGYLAGSSWRVVERNLGRASLVVLAMVAVLAALALGASWVAGNYAAVHDRTARLLERPRIRELRARYHRQIAFVRRRFDPRARFGLSLTIGVSLLLFFGWTFGELLDEVLEGSTSFLDRPVIEWLATHRTPELTDAMRATTTLGATFVALTVLPVSALVAYVKTRSLRLPAVLAFCLVGAVGLSPVVKSLVQRARPDISPVLDPGGFAFPSGHATTAAILCAGLAYALTRRRSWRAGVWVWAVAGAFAFLIGFSRTYLGVHWPTDVVGGWLLGLMWVALGDVVVDLSWEAGARSPRREPGVEVGRATSRR